MAHTFGWASIFEFIALVSTAIIFIQILFYADNLHRQHKLILIITSIVTWIVGGFIILLVQKYKDILMVAAYLLFASHMLPQVRQNSLVIDFNRQTFGLLDFTQFTFAHSKSRIKIFRYVFSIK
jgi:hypothetical protein